MKRFFAVISVCLTVGVYALPASAVTVGGVAVDAPASTDDSISVVTSMGIEYYIPLTSDHAGTYGVGTVPCGTTGQCSDSGDGYRYTDADALLMNIYFDLTDEPASQQAELEFWFKDIDLDPTNDPHGFFESVKLSYWDAGTNTLVSVGDVIDQASELTSGVFSNAETTPEFLIDPTDDPITWTIDLTLLTGLGVDVLAALNYSVANDDGFWVQLGFGSKYKKTGNNTPEFLTADLTVAPVPLPAAFWLFGSALIGFIGMSRRTRV